MRLGCLSLLALTVVGHGFGLAQSPVIRSGPRTLAGAVGGESLPDVSSHVLPAQPAQPTPPDGGEPAMGEGQQQQPGQQMSDAARRQQELADHHWGPNETLWLGGGPLVMWFHNGRAPGPLVTTGAAGLGALNQPDTQVLFGLGEFDYGTFAGFHVKGGLWFNEKRTWGVEAAGFITEERTITSAFASDATGTPLLARPVFDATTGTEISQVISSPGAAVGGVLLESDSQLAGAEVGLVHNVLHDCNMDLDLLAGFRYLDLDENLLIGSNSFGLGPVPFFALGGLPLPPGSTLFINDRFNTRNQFYGGQIGGRWQVRRGVFSGGLTGKVAFGPNHQTQRLTGSTLATLPAGAGTAVVPGGLLVLPGANIGRSTTNWFAIVPEVGAEVGVQLTDWLRGSVGYNYLYINKVVRPGAVVNRQITPSLVPTSPIFGTQQQVVQPQVSTAQENFWAHGLQLTLEVRY